MSELEDRLNAVLSNPAEFSRLSEMARRLMGGAEAESSDAAPAPKQERDVLSALPAMLGQALGGLGKSRRPALLEAVSPYLDDGRQRRLERALRLASTAKLAGTALRQMGGENGL